MAITSATHVHEKLRVDFASLKHAKLKGVYIAPAPDNPRAWSGVLFPRKGPYAGAVLRFHVAFPVEYPARPPVLAFLCDVFHPLVTPWTTHTHTARDDGAATMSSADRDRLPPGGLTLRHGFPEWHAGQTTVTEPSLTRQTSTARHDPGGFGEGGKADAAAWPHIVEVLRYLRIAFDTMEVIDDVPLERAANPGAWHAWRSHRAKVAPAAAARLSPGGGSGAAVSQPGGARLPGQWNWQGVWEDRVRKCVEASRSEHALFGAEEEGVVRMSCGLGRAVIVADHGVDPLYERDHGGRYMTGLQTASRCSQCTCCQSPEMTDFVEGAFQMWPRGKHAAIER
ncbi:hypothetical protein LTR53_014767 [Teratosphaeriaceae sp. CCFEE 6253]|nr:hypothetical protein LTR53_014767 [Teratosphaeriaceae sp. CCFEE 6253]